MKRLILFFALPCLLYSCRTHQEVNPEDFNEVSGTGLVIGTVTFDSDKPVNDIYRFFFEPTTGDKRFIRQNKGRIFIKARDRQGKAFNGDFNNKQTYLFAFELKPGKYAFNQYNYLDNIGYTGLVSSSEKFEIPFVIESGTIAYIGELIYYDKPEDDMPKIIVNDNYERDLDEFEKKFPDAEWGRAENMSVKKGDTGNGIISFM